MWPDDFTIFTIHDLLQKKNYLSRGLVFERVGLSSGSTAPIGMTNGRVTVRPKTASSM
jgi:hypothetical protein